MSDNVTHKLSLREAVAEEVRALLGRRRMSDIGLARLIGRSHTYVYRRLTGETAFDLDDLALIAEALQVRVVDLIPQRDRGVNGGYTPTGDKPDEGVKIPLQRSPYPGARHPVSRADSRRPPAGPKRTSPTR